MKRLQLKSRLRWSDIVTAHIDLNHFGTEPSPAVSQLDLELGTLRAVLIYSGQWARVQGGASKVKMLKTRENHGRALTGEEETLLVQECAKSRSWALVPMVLVALYTGARFGVVRHLTWSNINFRARCPQFGQDKTQSGDHRIIPLARRALEALTLWADLFRDRRPEHFVFPSQQYGGAGHEFKGHKERRSTAYNLIDGPDYLDQNGLEDSPKERWHRLPHS